MSAPPVTKPFSSKLTSWGVELGVIGAFLTTEFDISVSLFAISWAKSSTAFAISWAKSSLSAISWVKSSTALCNSEIAWS